jgi:hypothetical protein
MLTPAEHAEYVEEYNDWLDGLPKGPEDFYDVEDDFYDEDDLTESYDEEFYEDEPEVLDYATMIDGDWPAERDLDFY